MDHLYIILEPGEFQGQHPCIPAIRHTALNTKPHFENNGIKYWKYDKKDIVFPVKVKEKFGLSYTAILDFMNDAVGVIVKDDNGDVNVCKYTDVEIYNLVCNNILRNINV